MRLGLSLAVSQPRGANAATPLTIFGSNLRGWLNETYAAGVWVDESGVGVNTSQANAGNRPAATTINSHPAVAFTAASAHGLNWGGDRELITTEGLIAAVIQSGSIGDPAVICGKVLGTIGPWLGGRTGSNKLIFDVEDAADGSGAISAAGYADNAPHVVVGVRSGTTQRLYIDGTTAEADTGTKAAVPNTNAFLSVGCGMNGDEATMNYHWQGKIGQVIGCNVAPSGAQLAALVAYLKTWAGVP